MRLLRSNTLVLIALLVAVALTTPASAWSAVGATSPAGGVGESSPGNSGNVTGQGQQLSKLTQEQSPEEREEELAEKNVAALKAKESKSIPTGLVVLVGAVAVTLIGGIAFLILRDARSVAPAAGLPEPGSAGRIARQRRRRAKARAARQSRKRNR